MHKDPMEKFIDAIDVLRDGCWQWRNSLASDGYGKFWIAQTQFLAHRFSYQLYIGEIPEGLQLDHQCRNRGCVNPEHLEPVTQKENILRGAGLAAIAAKSTKCPKGHPYDAVNTRGNRFCRGCHYENVRKSKERRSLHVKTR